MARSWPVESIPDSSVVPDGVYLLTIASFEEKQNRKGGLMYAGEFRVVEPQAFAGSPLYENFSIGTEEDQEAEDPETWKASVGARILKRVFKAAGVEASDDIDDMIAAAEQQHVTAIVARVVDDGKNDPQYKGRERNRITAWYAPGEREIKVEGLAASKPKTAGLNGPKPAARRTAVEEEEEEVAAPPAKRGPGRPKATEEAGPPAKKVAPAAAAASTATEKTVTCDICQEKVAVKGFSAHVAKHEEDEE